MGFTTTLSKSSPVSTSLHAIPHSSGTLTHIHVHPCVGPSPSLWGVQTMGIEEQPYYSNTTRTAILLFIEGKATMSFGRLPSGGVLVRHYGRMKRLFVISGRWDGAGLEMFQYRKVILVSK
jgi:hypothetical protein